MQRGSTMFFKKVAEFKPPTTMQAPRIGDTAEGTARTTTFRGGCQSPWGCQSPYRGYSDATVSSGRSDEWNRNAEVDVGACSKTGWLQQLGVSKMAKHATAAVSLTAVEPGSAHPGGACRVHLSTTPLLYLQRMPLVSLLLGFIRERGHHLQLNRGYKKYLNH
jgi:hypothetical protein